MMVSKSILVTLIIKRYIALIPNHPYFNTGSAMFFWWPLKYPVNSKNQTVFRFNTQSSTFDTDSAGQPVDLYKYPVNSQKSNDISFHYLNQIPKVKSFKTCHIFFLTFLCLEIVSTYCFFAWNFLVAVKTESLQLRILVTRVVLELPIG